MMTIIGTSTTFSDVTHAGPVLAFDTYTFKFRLHITDTVSADKTGIYIYIFYIYYQGD